MCVRDGEPDDIHSIDLKPVLGENQGKMIKYVTFDGIRKDSIMRYHEKEMHARLIDRDQTLQDKIYTPAHLLNLTVANTAYVYDLDTQAQLEKKSKGDCKSGNF